MRPLRAALVVGVLATSPASPARGSLPRDIDQLASRFRALGATVEVLRPHVVTSGSPVWLAVPVKFLEGPPGECTTLVVLGSVSTVFALRTVAEPSTLEVSREQIPSVAGAAALRRCGEGRGMLLHVLVDVRSTRAVLETIAVSSRVPVPAVQEVLPHRNPGTLPGATPPGPAPPPATLVARSTAAETRLGQSPGATVRRQVVPSESDGAGQIPLDLQPGCHRFVVMGMPGPSGEEPGDIDAQLASAAGEVLDADRTESPDAALVTCVGEARRLLLQFAGARPSVPVLVLQGETPLPSQVPEAFGVEARARFARALLERSIPAPREPPRFVSLGVAGTTSMPVELETGQCYLAALIPIQGDSRLLSLSATVGAVKSSAHSDDPAEAATLAFCAGAADRGHLGAEVHGTSLAWGAALWPLSRTRLGEETP